MIADLDRASAPRARVMLRLFATAMALEVLTSVASGVRDVHRGMLYPYRHLPIVPLYSERALMVEWAATLLCAGAIASGRAPRITYRATAIVLVLAVLQRFSNHGALMAIVACFLALAPPDLEAPSFDAAPHPELGLCRAQLAIVYVASALNKVVHGFGDGHVLRVLVPSLGPLAPALAWGVIAVELALPVLLVRRPRLGIVAVALLHAGFALVVPHVLSFGLTMVALSWLYLPPPAPQRG